MRRDSSATNIELRRDRWNNAVNLFRKGDARGALFVFKAMAKEGSEAALAQIAYIYERGGRGVSPDYERSRQWYEKAIRVADDCRAYLGLARHYYFGLGTERDYKKAFQYLSQITEADEPVALMMLGHMYRLGRFVKVDRDLARSYYQRSSDLGNLIVFRYLAILDFQEGHWYLATKRWLLGMARALKMMFKDPFDSGLRA